MPRQPTARVARAVVALATTWFVLAAAWGIAAAPGGGHLGSSGAATSMMGEHAVRFRTVFPLWHWYAPERPGLEDAYCHHPFGVFWIAAAFASLWPHRDFVVQLPAVAMSAAMPALLYGIGRRIGGRAVGPLAGAAAALAFVAVPIDVGYACFASLEVTVMFGVALCFWAHLVHQEGGRARHLALSLVGVAFAALGDWVGYLILAPWFAWGLLRTSLLADDTTKPLARRHRRRWALSLAVCTGCLALTLGLFAHANQLADWLRSGKARGADGHLDLAAALARRAPWIDFSFTPLVVTLGKLALPVGAARALARRRDEEVMPLAVLFGAGVQYVAFRGGADRHVFWPHYFGLYFALAMAQLTASASWAARRGAVRASLRRPDAAATVAASIVGLAVPSLVLPDAARALVIWRQTGGRYDDRGARFRSGADVLFVLTRLVRGRLPLGESIGVHPGTEWGWEHQWALEGSGSPAGWPAPGHRFWIARASGLGADRLRELVATRHVRVYGDALLVERDADSTPAPLDAFSLHEREPSPFERYFTHPTEPVRSLDATPDPFLTWEWRVHLGQPAPEPAATPRSLDEVRIAHNAAVARGDAAEAGRLRASLEAAIDRSHAVEFVGGHRLLGVRLPGGVKPQLEAWFLAGGPTSSDATFAVRSTVVRPLDVSLLPASSTVRRHGYPPPLSTKLWRAGFIYRLEAELLHRVGEERYDASLAGSMPIPTTTGATEVQLAVLR